RVAAAVLDEDELVVVVEGRENGRQPPVHQRHAAGLVVAGDDRRDLLAPHATFHQTSTPWSSSGARPISPAMNRTMTARFGMGPTITVSMWSRVTSVSISWRSDAESPLPRLPSAIRVMVTFSGV